MARYEITLKQSVKKDFRRIDQQHIPALLECIESLKEQPRPSGCKKLWAKALYRVRVGDFRIVYEIVDLKLIVIVVAVNKRSRAYRK